MVLLVVCPWPFFTFLAKHLPAAFTQKTYSVYSDGKHMSALSPRCCDGVLAYTTTCECAWFDAQFREQSCAMHKLH